MSRMETFIGRFEKAVDQSILCKDTDDFYDLEEQHGCHYVNVDGVIFKIWSIVNDLDEYGFAEAIGPQEGPILVLYWYNGGASLREVAEAAIRNYQKSDSK